MRKPTRHELATLPYVYLTSDASWEPSVLDSEFEFQDSLIELPEVVEHRNNRDARIDNFGNLQIYEEFSAAVTHQDAEGDVFFDATST